MANQDNKSRNTRIIIIVVLVLIAVGVGIWLIKTFLAPIVTGIIGFLVGYIVGKRNT